MKKYEGIKSIIIALLCGLVFFLVMCCVSWFGSHYIVKGTVVSVDDNDRVEINTSGIVVEYKFDDAQKYSEGDEIKLTLSTEKTDDFSDDVVVKDEKK